MSNHILIIDDDQAILEAVQVLLELQGYRVSVIKDAQSVFDQLATLNPDLILLDLLLSGADGRDISRKIKATPETQAIPIILMSADTNIREKSQEAQADAFIKKPFDITDLEQKIAGFLSKD